VQYLPASTDFIQLVTSTLISLLYKLTLCYFMSYHVFVFLICFKLTHGVKPETVQFHLMTIFSSQIVVTDKIVKTNSVEVQNSNHKVQYSITYHVSSTLLY